ncbi:MAG TPA: septal ring lytic transglycosylase RlpA family protein [Stellaceae bacterium]|jgi:rare lipoprotein A
MLLRQTIGMSLVLLMASAGAMAQTPEAGASQQPGQPPDPGHQNFANRLGNTPSSTRAAYSRQPMQMTWRPQGAPQIGQAAWYDLVGRQTADGERLDTVTPTAAHRSLPLGSCARVVDLDTGRAVIVRINDRGPYHRRFIIDLSPRAAEELGMRYAGVAAVAVEPVAVAPAAAAPAANAASASTIAASYRIAGANVTQWAR